MLCHASPSAALADAVAQVEGAGRLRRAARLVGAVVVAVVTVRVPLPQLPARLLLLTAAAAVAVAVVGRRRRPPGVLLVVPVTLVVAVGLLFCAAARLCVVPADERHPSLGVVQGLKVVVAVAVGDGALRHHLQVGPDAVVAGTRVVAEVDDPALVGAFVGWLYPGEAEFMGDVASYNLHDLEKAEEIRDISMRVNNRILEVINSDNIR